jgi:hypothetical protein
MKSINYFILENKNNVEQLEKLQRQLDSVDQWIVTDSNPYLYVINTSCKLSKQTVTEMLKLKSNIIQYKILNVTLKPFDYKFKNKWSDRHKIREINTIFKMKNIQYLIDRYEDNNDELFDSSSSTDNDESDSETNSNESSTDNSQNLDFHKTKNLCVNNDDYLPSCLDKYQK